MTYDKLMQSLDKLPVHDSMTSFVSWVFLIGAVIFTLITLYSFAAIFIPSLEETAEEKEKYKNTPRSERIKIGFRELNSVLILCGVLTVICAIMSYGFHGKVDLSFEEKKTSSNNDIITWEHGEDFKAYLETLPTKQILINDKKIESATNGEIYLTIKYRGKKKELYIESKDIYKVRKEDLRKGEPKQSYLEVKEIPKDITYNYPKGRVIPLKLVQVW